MFSSDVKIISVTSQKENYKKESSSSGLKHIKNQQHQNFHLTQKSHHCQNNNTNNNNNNSNSSNNFNQHHNANINVNNNSSNNHRIKKSNKNNNSKIQSARKKVFVNNNNSYNSNCGSNTNNIINNNNNNSEAKNQNIISSSKGFNNNSNIGNIKDFKKYNSNNNLQENYIRNSKQTGYNNLSYINPLQVLMVMSDTSNTIIEKNNNVNNAVTKSNEKRNKSTNNNNNNSNNNINNYNSINTNINNTSNNDNNNNNNCNTDISNNNNSKNLKSVSLQSSNLTSSNTTITASVPAAQTVARAPFPGNNTVTTANITATTKQQSSNIEAPITVTSTALTSTSATTKTATTIEVVNTITDSTTSTITTTTTGNSSPSRGGISSQSSQASYSLDFLHSVGIQMTAGSNRTYSSPSSPRHSPYINSGRHRCAIAYSQEHPGGLLTDHQIASTYSKSSLKDRNFENPILHHPAVASRSLASPLHGGVSPSFLYNPHNYPQSTNFFHHHNHSPYYHHHQQNLHYHNMNAMAHPFPPMRNHSFKKNWNWTPPNVASSVAATTMASNGAMTASSIAAASTVKRYNNTNNTNYGSNNNCSNSNGNAGGFNVDKGANGNGNYSSMSNLNKFGSLPLNNSNSINNNSNNCMDSNVQSLPRARSHQNIKNLAYILSESNSDSFNGSNHIDSGLGTGTSGSGATTNTGRYNMGNSRPSTPSTKSESPSIHRTSSITHQQQQQLQHQQGNSVVNLQQQSINHQQQLGMMDQNAHTLLSLPGGQGSQQHQTQYPQAMSTDISAANSTINGYESDSSHSSCRRSEYEFRIKNHRTAGQGPAYQMGEMMSLLNFPTYSDEDIPKHHQPSFYGSHNLMFWNTINPNYATHSIYSPGSQISTDCGTNQYITDSKRSQSQSRTYRGRRQLYTSFRAHSYHENFYTPPDKFLAKAHLVEVKLAPETLMNGSKWDQLSQGIWNKFVMAQQTEETYKKKMYLWRYLYITIKKAYPRYGLYLVGSTISGFGADTSDVDMCLVSRNVSNIDPRMEALCNLTVLKEYLLQSGAFEQFNLIEAKVPILRFKDSMHMLEVDLNFNNCVGIRNTHLLHCYSQLDWRLRPLVLVAKLWAQFHNINNAKNMTISSYSLALMVIHFLQYAVQPPVLPCLHDMFPEKFQIILKSNDFGFVDMTEDIGPYESQNNQTLGELFLQFLEYYSNFDYSQYAISVRTGSVLPIEICRLAKSIKNDVHQWKELCIEEPFDLTNTARSVYDCETFERVKAVFVKSWKILEATLDLNSIFAPVIHQNPSSSSSATSQVPLNMNTANIS